MIAIGIIALAAVMFGAPMFVVFGAAALALYLTLPEGSWASPGVDMFGVGFAEQPTLITLPLFTFVGYTLARSGMPRRLIALSRAWLGWLPGHMAIVCLLTSAFFTTFTGGSGVTIIAIGGLLMPAMIRDNYPERFTLGLITTGGSLGILFPPSVPLLIYGIVAHVPVGKLMVAGIIPGLLVLAVLCAYGMFVGLRVGFTKRAFVWREALRTLWVAKWELAIPAVLLGGFGTGTLRIHEATALMALYVVFIEVVIYRDIDVRRDLPRVVVDSVTLVGAVLVIMACAVGFTGFLIQIEVPLRLVDFVQSTVKSHVVFLLALNVCLVLIGMLLEIFAALVLAVPLVLPVANAYGIDPYHFAVMFVLSLEIAYLVPPLGLNLFISSIRFGRSITSVYHSVLGFIGVLFITLMLVSFVPALVTWLPSFVKEDDVRIGSPLTEEQRRMLGLDPPRELDDAK